MPTGYTQELTEKGQTLKEYAMCAVRAFLWQCRDNYDPLPEKFEPNSYLSDGLKSAEAEFTKLTKMTPKQRLVYGDKVKRVSIQRYKKVIASEIKVNARLNKMARAVEVWVIPATLDSLKEFMLRQIEVSREDPTYLSLQLKKAQRLKPLSLWREALNSAKRDIKYHTEKITAYKLQLDQQNEFLKDLRDAL